MFQRFFNMLNLFLHSELGFKQQKIVPGFPQKKHFVEYVNFILLYNENSTSKAKSPPFSQYLLQLFNCLRFWFI